VSCGCCRWWSTNNVYFDLSADGFCSRFFTDLFTNSSSGSATSVYSDFPADGFCTNVFTNVFFDIYTNSSS
jgi:hypothetical protein